MQSAGFLLASVCRNKTSMKAFGYLEAKGDDRFNFNNPQLPKFFGSHLDPSWVCQNTRVVLENLKVQRGTRGWVMGFDETNYAVGYSTTFF